MTLGGGISQRGLVSKQKAWQISSHKREECGIPFYAFLLLNFFGYLLLAIAFSYLQEILFFYYYYYYFAVVVLLKMSRSISGVDINALLSECEIPLAVRLFPTSLFFLVVKGLLRLSSWYPEKDILFRRSNQNMYIKFQNKMI